LTDWIPANLAELPPAGLMDRVKKATTLDDADRLYESGSPPN